MRIKRFKPAYLLFLAIPLLYCFLQHNGAVPSNADKQDYFYFSVMTSKPAVISLFASGDSLTSWQVNSAGYKYLDYTGKFNDSKGIVLKVKNLSANDTVCFSAFNLYRGNRILSLYKHDESNCIVNNATVCETGEALTTIVKSPGTPVDVRLLEASSWEKSGIDRWFKILIIISFVFAFLLIVIIAPPVRYFIISCALVLLLMVLFFLIGQDFHCKVTLSSKTPVKSFQTFYNNNPSFVTNKMAASVNGGNSFTTLVYLNTDNCIRFDADGSAELDDVHYRINAGIISDDWDLSSLPQSKIMLNDLMLRNNKFHVTGDDPHFIFTSNYFTDRVRWIILTRKNLFLFLSLLVIIILARVHRWTARISLKRLHPVYLCFLIIPATYYFFFPISNTVKPKHTKELLYFSIKTTKPSIVELDDAGNCIASWEVNSAGYKYLQYSVDSINDDASISIKVKNLTAHDTLSILSVSAFHNDQVISLNKDKGPLCQLTNAGIIQGNGTMDAIVQAAGEPVSIKLPLLYSWQKSTNERDIEIYILILFIALFLIILVIAPQIKYFIASCLLTLGLMVSFYFVFRNVHSQAAMLTGGPVKSVDFFYNNNPCFNADKKVSFYRWTSFFKTDLNLSENNYLRCDINENTRQLKDFHVITKAGYFQNEMNFSKIAPDKMLVNDMNYRNGIFTITGDDPYFCLTSDYLMSELQWPLLLRTNLFLFISLFVFLILMPVSKATEKRHIKDSNESSKN
jgi:hypothetical protein